jgi:thiol-disulfide isomerase/thioredoxin
LECVAQDIMDTLFNQYSYLTFTTLGTLFILVVLWRRRVRRPYVGLVGMALVIVFTVGWLLLRPGTSDIDSVSAAEQTINSGRPTLVEFYSNYCIGCMAIRASVDDLVAQSNREFGDDLNIIRIDIHTELGRALRERYGFSYSPEFVLFDNTGSEVWRAHVPPTLGELENVVTAATGAVAG